MKKVSVRIKFLFGLVLVLLLAGCGLKANPVPPMAAALPALGEQVLIATAVENAVVLTWQFQNKDAKVSHITIEKSQLGSAGNTCKDCPRTFERIGQLSVSAEKSEYRFPDSSVEHGKNYSYRLRLCDEAGVCRESSTAEIDFK